ISSIPTELLEQALELRRPNETGPLERSLLQMESNLMTQIRNSPSINMVSFTAKSTLLDIVVSDLVNLNQ
ncbi:MAG: hypothetical protein MHPSP_002881, partial [Paramarteilia canceri]